MQYQIFFSIRFLILEIYKNVFNVESLYHKDSNMFRPLNKVKPRLVSLVLGWVTKYEYRVLLDFFSLFPFLFQGDRTADLPSLCKVVSSIYQLFVPHFAMTVFMCIYLHYRINKKRDMLFEFSSILSTVDLSKHVITA